MSTLSRLTLVKPTEDYKKFLGYGHGLFVPWSSLDKQKRKEQF